MELTQTKQARFQNPAKVSFPAYFRRCSSRIRLRLGTSCSTDRASLAPAAPAARPPRASSWRRKKERLLTTSNRRLRKRYTLNSDEGRKAFRCSAATSATIAKLAINDSVASAAAVLVKMLDLAYTAMLAAPNATRQMATAYSLAAAVRLAKEETYQFCPQENAISCACRAAHITVNVARR